MKFTWKVITLICSINFTKSPLALLFLFTIAANSLFSQTVTSEKTSFTRQDTLRGSITPEREWWDLTYYHLDIEVKPDERFISGKNTIHYKVLKPFQVMQIDLQTPMSIEKVTQNNEELEVIHEGNAHFIQLNEAQNIGDLNAITVHYQGHPKVAVRAPWDGGLSWKKDENIV